MSQLLYQPSSPLSSDAAQDQVTEDVTTADLLWCRIFIKYAMQHLIFPFRPARFYWALTLGLELFEKAGSIIYIDTLILVFRFLPPCFFALFAFLRVCYKV